MQSFLLISIIFLFAIVCFLIFEVGKLNKTVEKMKAIFAMSGPEFARRIEDGSSRFIINNTSSWEDVDDIG